MQSGGNISPLCYSKLYTLWNDKLRSGRNHSLNRLYNLEYIKQIHYLTNLCDYRAVRLIEVDLYYNIHESQLLFVTPGCMKYFDTSIRISMCVIIIIMTVYCPGLLLKKQLLQVLTKCH